LLWQTSGSDALCAKKPAPIIKKTQYKIQMTYPIPTATGRRCCTNQKFNIFPLSPKLRFRQRA